MDQKTRNIDEITQMTELLKKSLDYGKISNLDPLRYDVDFNYCLDILAILNQYLLENQDGRSIGDIISEIKGVNKRLNAFDEGIVSEKYRIKLDEMYHRNYQYRNAESSLCIADLYEWLSKKVSTEDFIISYLPIERLSEKRQGIKPIEWENGVNENMALKQITENEKKELYDIIEKLSKIHRDIQKLKKIRESILKKILSIRAKRFKEISLEKNERGTRKYPNRSAIIAELTIQLEDESEYQNLIKQYAEIKDQEISKIIEYNQNIDKKSVLMGILLDNEKLKMYIYTPFSTS